ncbi:MAG: glycosyltransferase [Candidatus Competibacteraceae bacterium]|nr:glycosyltransferase [Candidatus Competibacteraceae bacterium]
MKTIGFNASWKSKNGKKPVISVIMPVYNVELKWLKAAISSVRHKIYPHWQLCIVDDHSSRQETLDHLKSLEYPAIQLKILTENQESLAS